MNLALRKPMTLPEFLEWESGQELRYEFDGFQPVAKTGGTRAHATVQSRRLSHRQITRDVLQFPGKRSENRSGRPNPLS
jgi:hypothetical protein